MKGVSVEVAPTRSLVMGLLGVGRTTLWGYCKFFQEVLPLEFKYRDRQQVFTESQVSALKWLVRKKKQGYQYPDLVDGIKRRGLPNEYDQ